MDFPRHADCTLCPLHETAKNPFVPARTLSENPASTRHILFIGEAPGYHEDLETTCWIGASGKLLTQFISASSLSDHATIHLSNACRCRPPQATSPSAGQISHCRSHLTADILSILSTTPTPTELILVLLGAHAVRSVFGPVSLTDSFRHQSLLLTPDSTKLFSADKFPTIPIRVFSTYHPAMLMSGRKPALIHAVASHFTILSDYVRTGQLPYQTRVTPLYNLPVPPSLPTIALPWGSEPLVSLDIETYGILRGKNQSVFHPLKSLHVDGIPLQDQIVSVSFCTSDFRTYVYSSPDHRQRIAQWLRLLSRSNALVIGQNIKFDLLYLMSSYPTYSTPLRPGSLRIDDTILLSFLQYEQRPERGLKELAFLFGIANYADLKVTGSSGTATSNHDPDLLLYNCIDTHVTMSMYHYLIRLIREKFGPSSPKLSRACLDFRNSILWDCICLEQSGYSMSTPKLRSLHTSLTKDIHRITTLAKQDHDLILSGPGSDKSVRTAMLRIRDSLGLQSSPSVVYTDKRKDIAVNSENINLFLSRDPTNEKLALLKQHHEQSKIVNTYTHKLLYVPSKGIVHTLPGNTIGMCYPTWYPVPRTDATKGNSDKGGTIQGRFSCKQPAAQTDPPVIHALMVSRYPDGKIVGYDESQIELRTSALLSGDPLMLSEYRTGIDRHAETAHLVFPDIPPDHPFFRPVYRQAGKTLNFLIIYRGGPAKFQETVLKDVGLQLPLEVCKEAINRFYSKYVVFKEWQDKLIDTAARVGYIELPTGWSRTFGKGQSAIDSYINEICNFPIQTIAAQLTQSAQYAILLDLQRLRAPVRITLNIQDALYFDLVSSYEPTLDQIVHPHLTRPPILSALESYYGCSVPLLYEKATL